METWRDPDQTRPDQTQRAQLGVCSECSEDQLCQMASPYSLFPLHPQPAPTPHRHTGQAQLEPMARGLTAGCPTGPQKNHQKERAQLLPWAKPFRPRSGEGGRFHHSGHLPRSRTDPPQIHRFKGHQQRAGHQKRQDQTSEKPGRGDPEVTSDLMTTPPPPTRSTSEGLEYAPPPPPAPAPRPALAGVGKGSKLRAHL